MPYRISTLTSKDQFTIPQTICRRLGLARGDLVWLSVPHHGALAVTPMRVAAIRSDAAYRRFSVRCVARADGQRLGVLGRLTAQQVTRYTQQPEVVERAVKQPDAWVALAHSA